MSYPVVFFRGVYVHIIGFCYYELGFGEMLVVNFAITGHVREGYVISVQHWVVANDCILPKLVHHSDTGIRKSQCTFTQLQIIPFGDIEPLCQFPDAHGNPIVDISRPARPDRPRNLKFGILVASNFLLCFELGMAAEGRIGGCRWTPRFGGRGGC